MLNASDLETVVSLRRLQDVVTTATRPLIFWIGAGSSRWLGYPSWKDLTLGIRRDFWCNVPGFDNRRALELLNKEDFPAVFQMCKDLDTPRYHRFIAETFVPRSPTGTYRRLISLLAEVGPLFMLTTNVDESLEHHVSTVATVQRSDLSRCVDLLQKQAGFVAKLHGSVSSVTSTIFTTTDYDSLVDDESYIQALKYIFTGCTVVFLGYGVRDSYVIRLLSQDAAERALFGAGPHFVVTNDTVAISSLHRIQYETRLNPDHKAALSVLDLIRQARVSSGVSQVTAPETTGPTQRVVSLAVPPGRSAYYISDFIPPGLWQTSQDISAEGESGAIEASVGLGFTNDEVVSPVSTALHDMVVGLICFDYVYLPFSALGAVHDSLGSELFWEFVRLDVLRFIHNHAKIGILFRKGEAIGGIANIIGGTRTGPEPAPMPELIRAILTPAPGKDAEAARLFTTLEEKTAIYGRNVELDLPSLVRSSLLMPNVSRLLGIGDAILPTQSPRWLRFPYLRLAHLVQTAAICAEYGIQASKVPFGGTVLTAAAFGVQTPGLQADDLASYVSSGEYNSDLGALVYNDPSVMKSILHFRSSADGEAFRKSTSEALATEDGRVFDASVNAGLSRLIPIDILQRARDRLLTLMTGTSRITPVRAVWSSSVLTDSSTKYWRARSQKILLEMCKVRGIGKDDPCICGSGDKMRLCCLPPLRQ